MNDAELIDTPVPDNVAITCASPNNRDCVITWEKPCTDESPTLSSSPTPPTRASFCRPPKTPCKIYSEVCIFKV